MRPYFLLLALLAVLYVSYEASASLVYIPKELDAKQGKILVVIHGCLQNAESMSSGSQFNEIAEKNNLVVVYPQVPKNSNALSCWNWFLPENQTATGGQLGLIMGELKNIRRQLRLENKNIKIYVAGISSGAATAAGLLACYPKYFTAGAIHSGPSYGLAQSFEESKIVLASGPGDRPNGGPCDPATFEGSIFVIQGKEDKVVHPSNAPRVIADFVTRGEPFETQDIMDAQGKPFYTQADFRANKSRGRLIVVPSLGHAWSGTPESINQPFFSKEGPNATLLMWEYFMAASSRRPETGKKKGSKG